MPFRIANRFNATLVGWQPARPPCCIATPCLNLHTSTSIALCCEQVLCGGFLFKCIDTNNVVKENNEGIGKFTFGFNSYTRLSTFLGRLHAFDYYTEVYGFKVAL